MHSYTTERVQAWPLSRSFCSGSQYVVLVIVEIELGDPTLFICARGLGQDGLLCYPPRQDHFNGIGHACRQERDDDQVNSGLGKLKC